MKKIIKTVLAFIILFAPILINAEEPSEENYYLDGKITLSNEVLNDSDGSNTYKYHIEPLDGNPSNPSNDMNKDFTINQNDTYELDFSNINYNKTGIYEYLLTEVETSDIAKYHLTNIKYKIIVFVTNNNNEYHANVYKKVYDLNNDTKKNELKYEYNKYTYFKLKYDVTGKSGDTHKYFKLGIKIEGNKGDIYTIRGLEESVSYNGEETSNPTKIEVGDEPTEIFVYVKHGQELSIGLGEELGENLYLYEVPVGTTVSVTVYDSNLYYTTINNEVTKKMTVYETDENTIAIVNKLDLDNPYTGINQLYIPFLTLIALAIIITIVSLIKVEIKE